MSDAKSRSGRTLEQDLERNQGIFSWVICPLGYRLRVLHVWHFWQEAWLTPWQVWPSGGIWVCILVCSGSERSPSLLGWSSAKSAPSTDLQVFLASISHQTDRYPPSSPNHWTKMDSKGGLRYLWPALPLASNAPCNWATLALNISISITSVNCCLNEIYHFLFKVLTQFQISPAGQLLCYFIISAKFFGYFFPQIILFSSKLLC